MSEYITLPSNVLYEGNTIAEFRTVLPSSKVLKGRWKVGLAKISFTKSWFNIKEPVEVSMVDSNGNIFISPVPVAAGYYTTERQIHDAVSSSITNLTNHIKNEENV